MAEPVASNYPAALATATLMGGVVANQKRFIVLGAQAAADPTIETTAVIAGVTAPCYLVNGRTGEIVYAEGIAGANFTLCVRGADGGVVATIMNDGDILHHIDVANLHNQLVREVIGVETELGVLPKSTSASVAERIASLRSLAGAAADVVQVGATEVVINEAGADIDLRVEGDTATNLLVLDAGLGAVQIGTTVAGVLADFRPATIVFNEAGADIDTRIESDADANCVFVDGGTGYVGIGTATPAYKLHVYNVATQIVSHEAAASGDLSVNATGNNNRTYQGLLGKCTTSGTKTYTGSCRGGTYTGVHSGTVVHSDVEGVCAIAENAGTGGINAAYGGRFQIANTGAGAIAYGYGFFVRNPDVVAGSITENYGLFIENQVAGGTNYAIYSNGGMSRHQGKFGLNRDPAQQLDVNGVTLLRDKLAFTQIDLNEYIDSLADGYLDLAATTQIRLNQDTYIGAKNLVTDDTTGTKLGASDTAKIGLYAATPIVRQNHIVDADGSLADATTKINAILVALENIGVVKTA
jgi:hypothetical protein